jgi:N-methylhydantoinase B
MRINRYELAPDSGGAGEHRGGNGTVREYEFLQKTTVQLVNERFQFGPYGLAGGERGQTGAAEHISDRHGTVQLSSKERFNADPGETLRVRSTGGGGYGSAEARSTDRVREDVAAGHVSPGRAKEKYGFRPDCDASGELDSREVETISEDREDDQ